MSSPLGLACSYCGSFFHAKCSSTYSEVVSDVLAIVKKVCVTCPCCEARLRSLPAKLEEVEKKLDEFVARVEEKFSDLKDSLLPAQRVCSPDVDKAVKDAVSAINNRDHVILYGLPETGSTIKDFETVKDIFDSLGVNDVKAVDVFRLGKVQSDVGVSQSKPRLLKQLLSLSPVPVIIAQWTSQSFVLCFHPLEAWKEKRTRFGDCVFLLEGFNLFKTCTQRQARQLTCEDITKRCCPYKICDFSLKPTQRYPAHTTPLKHNK
ncbi:hypothetical protein EMCRGX_G022784 [Ephydatia muelleri]